MPIELRIYKTKGKAKIRTAKIKNYNKFGLFSWIKLYYILNKFSVKAS